MTKTEIVKEVAEKLSLPKKTVKDVFEEAISMIYDADSTQIKGFGTFKWRTKKARTCRNPITGGTVEVPEKQRLCFIPSKQSALP